MDLPFWIVFVAVIPPFAIFGWYIRSAGRTSRYAALTLGAALVYGMAVEVLALHTSHNYDYANWWLMLGSRPDWVPIAIGICWACIVHFAMRTSDLLELPWWQRPFFDGAAAMMCDLVLDPVMSGTRTVVNTTLPCMDQKGPLQGGVELWTWCLPGDPAPPTWFDVPISNYVGWFIIITSFSLMVRVMHRHFRADERPWLTQVGILFLACVAGIAADAGVGTFIDLIIGAPTPARVALAAIVLLPWVLVLSQAKRLRFGARLPLGHFAWPLYGYGVWGALYFILRTDQDRWPAEALLMAATIAVGALLCVLPSIGRLRRSPTP